MQLSVRRRFLRCKPVIFPAGLPCWIQYPSHISPTHRELAVARLNAKVLHLCAPHYLQTDTKHEDSYFALVSQTSRYEFVHWRSLQSQWLSPTLKIIRRLSGRVVNVVPHCRECKNQPSPRAVRPQSCEEPARNAPHDRFPESWLKSLSICIRFSWILTWSSGNQSSSLSIDPGAICCGMHTCIW